VVELFGVSTLRGLQKRLLQVRLGQFFHKQCTDRHRFVAHVLKCTKLHCVRSGNSRCIGIGTNCLERHKLVLVAPPFGAAIESSHPPVLVFSRLKRALHLQLDNAVGTVDSVHLTACSSRQLLHLDASLVQVNGSFQQELGFLVVGDRVAKQCHAAPRRRYMAPEERRAKKSLRAR
jgi:hypothetical protein